MYFFFFLSFFLLFLWAAPVAYGGSQARGRIGAAAAGPRQSHSNTRSEPRLQPTPQLMAMPDPLTHWARPGTEPTTSWVLVRFVNHCATTGTPHLSALCSVWMGGLDSVVGAFTKTNLPPSTPHNGFSISGATCSKSHYIWWSAPGQPPLSW